MGQLPQYQAFHEKYGAKGLNIFQVGPSKWSLTRAQMYLEERGITYPNVVDDEGNDFSSYVIEGPLPVVYIIGVDGKVVFKGDRNSGDYAGAIEKEIAKVKYPGLGKNTLAKGLEKAAAAFVAKNYKLAIDECDKIIEKSKDDAAIGDARYVIERCNTLALRQRTDADAARAAKRYADAVAALEMLAAGFKGLESGDKAKAELAELRKDKYIKRELDADAALAKLVEAIKSKTRAEKSKALREFTRAKTSEGTQAAQEAKARADEIDAGN